MYEDEDEEAMDMVGLCTLHEGLNIGYWEKIGSHHMYHMGQRWCKKEPLDRWPWHHFIDISPAPPR